MSIINSKTPISLYVHIPWCIKKCPYCDFNSHTYKEELPENAYIDCLLEDLSLDIKYLDNRIINTIFIGGGTPSILSASAIQRLITQIKNIAPIKDDAEITMEANPGTFEQEKFNSYYNTGINRLSLGIQSFSSDKLKALGRVHSASEALGAIEVAKKAGFDNFNLDLMYALPAQTVNQAIEDLKMAILQEPKHISWYQLTLEPNTLFYKFPPKLPQDEVSWEISEVGKKLLSEHGYQQYEISAYAKDRKQCLHNLNYWQFGDYLGIGAGAHGKITNANSIIRTKKYRSPKDYLDKKKPYIQSIENISTNQLPFEFMLNALRLESGFSKELYSARTGLPFSSIKSIIDKAKVKNLISEKDKQLTLTELGKRFTDDLIMMFMEQIKDDSGKLQDRTR